MKQLFLLIALICVTGCSNQATQIAVESKVEFPYSTGMTNFASLSILSFDNGIEYEVYCDEEGHVDEFVLHMDIQRSATEAIGVSSTHEFDCSHTNALGLEKQHLRVDPPIAEGSVITVVFHVKKDSQYVTSIDRFRKESRDTFLTDSEGLTHDETQQYFNMVRE
ncbi:MAG: hypothetical protein AAGF95_29900 [Chloroflexota bacterium]